jgi:hypothetical protein
MRTGIMFGAALLALVGIPSGGDALPRQMNNCLDRGDMVSKLGTSFKELPVEAGVTDGGGVVELLRTANGESWTLILTYPSGLSCMMAAGQAWHMQSAPDQPKEPVS